MNRTYKKLMKRITIFLLLFFAFSFFSIAQKCPRNFYDCKGACGWFIDADHNGYCDFTSYSDALLQRLLNKKDSVLKTQQIKNQYINDSIKNAQLTVKHKDTVTQKDKSQTNQAIHHNCPFENTPECEKNRELQPETDKEDIIVQNQPEKKTSGYEIKKYDFVLIFGLCLLFYLVSLLFVKRKVYRKSTHRKIWNTLLLLSFLNTGLTGLFLVIQLNYLVLFSWFSKFLFWHVEFGISMAAISILHILWHWKYFRNLIIKRKEESDCSL